MDGNGSVAEVKPQDEHHHHAPEQQEYKEKPTPAYCLFVTPEQALTLLDVAEGRRHAGLTARLSGGLHGFMKKQNLLGVRGSETQNRTKTISVLNTDEMQKRNVRFVPRTKTFTQQGLRSSTELPAGDWHSDLKALSQGQPSLAKKSGVSFVKCILISALEAQYLLEFIDDNTSFSFSERLHRLKHLLEKEGIIESRNHKKAVIKISPENLTEYRFLKKGRKTVRRLKKLSSTKLPTGDWRSDLAMLSGQKSKPSKPSKPQKAEPQPERVLNGMQALTQAVLRRMSTRCDEYTLEIMLTAIEPGPLLQKESLREGNLLQAMTAEEKKKDLQLHRNRGQFADLAAHMENLMVAMKKVREFIKSM